MTREKLTCVAMVVCDDIFRDSITGKAILVGAFSTITCPTFPARHPKLAVFFSITNGNGEYDLSLSIEQESTGLNLITLQGPLHASDPLGIADIELFLQGVEFPEPGKYWVKLECDGEIINQRPIMLLQATSNTEPTEETDQ